MTSTDWIAYIGAAAWMPPIVFILYKLLALPKITFYPDRQVQIGYTTIGPIFNLTLALTVQRKDIILKKIGVKLSHQDGSKHNFGWARISETLSEIRNPLDPTPIMSVEKSLPPIIVKISTGNFVQVFIQFQDLHFGSELAKASSGFQKHFHFIREKKTKLTKEDIDDAIDCKEFEEIMDFQKSSFRWKKGRYELMFNIQSPNRYKMTKTKFVFNLTQHDADALRTNLDHIRTNYRQTLLTNVEGYKYETIPWVWRNPVCSEATKKTYSLLIEEE